MTPSGRESGFAPKPGARRAGTPGRRGGRGKGKWPARAELLSGSP